MSLIKCPECGKEISNKAKMCIHCGYPMDEYKEIIPENYEIYEPPLITQKFQVIMTSYGFIKNRIAEYFRKYEDMSIDVVVDLVNILNNTSKDLRESYFLMIDYLEEY